VIEAGRHTPTAAPTSSPWAVAALVWSAIFAAVHLYWAAGGRGGLGGSSDEADVALATGWFQLYNLVTAVLALAGAALAALLLRPGVSQRATRWIARLAAVAAVVLLLRGVLGVVMLVIETLGDGPSEPRPMLLLLVEPWFVLGGIVFGGVWRVAGGRR